MSNKTRSLLTGNISMLIDIKLHQKDRKKENSNPMNKGLYKKWEKNPYYKFTVYLF